MTRNAERAWSAVVASSHTPARAQAVVTTYRAYLVTVVTIVSDRRCTNVATEITAYWQGDHNGL